jgi:hypothetical protein
MRVIIYNIDEIIQTQYSPTLSSMEIIISDNDLIESILSDIYNIQNNHKGINKLEYIVNDNFTINLINNKLKIEYYENKLPHSRNVFIQQIENLFHLFKILKNITIDKIDTVSWFSIVWSSFKSTNQLFLNTTFLTYYSFNKYENNQEYTEIPLIGILPIKFDSNIFLTNINKNSECSNTNYMNILKKNIVKFYKVG